MKSIIKALGSSNFKDIKFVIMNLTNTPYDKNVVEKVERCEENRKK